MNENETLVVVPDDYRPRKPMDYMAVYLEHEEAVKLLSDEEAGKIFKQLFTFAKEYASTYDDKLMPDTKGVNNNGWAVYLANRIADGIRRAEQQRRRTSYSRSGVNNGGRPKKT